MWWLIVVGIILVIVALYLILNQSESGYSNSEIERYASQSQGVLMYKESDYEKDQFNEALIQRELARLAETPDLLQQYVLQLRQRFTKYTQLKVIEKWTDYYAKGAALVEGNTRVKRAKKENERVDIEDEVERAKLEADKEEHLTRAVNARYKREQISRKAAKPEKSEEDLKMQAARDRDRRDIRFKVERTILKNVTTLAEIQRIEDKQTDIILNCSDLTTEQKRAQLKQLHSDCEEAKKNLNIDIDLYENE
jgi:hypothetical protein